MCRAFFVILIILTVNISTSIAASTPTYIVFKKDTLMHISFLHYGTHHCWNIIQKLNPQVKDPDIIETGSIIKIPDRTECHHPNASHLISLSPTEKIKPNIPSPPKEYLDRKDVNHFIVYDKRENKKRALPKLKGSIDKKHRLKPTYSDPILLKKRIAKRQRIKKQKEKEEKLKKIVSTYED